MSSRTTMVDELEIRMAGINFLQRSPRTGRKLPKEDKHTEKHNKRLSGDSNSFITSPSIVKDEKHLILQDKKDTISTHTDFDKYVHQTATEDSNRPDEHPQDVFMGRRTAVWEEDESERQGLNIVLKQYNVVRNLYDFNLLQ